MESPRSAERLVLVVMAPEIRTGPEVRFRLATTEDLPVLLELFPLYYAAIRLEVTKSNPKAYALYARLGFEDHGRSLLAYPL